MKREIGADDPKVVLDEPAHLVRSNRRPGAKNQYDQGLCRQLVFIKLKFLSPGHSADHQSGAAGRVAPRERRRR